MFSGQTFGIPYLNSHNDYNLRFFVTTLYEFITLRSVLQNTINSLVMNQF